MKKVLLTSAVALAAFGAVQAVSADDYTVDYDKQQQAVADAAAKKQLMLQLRSSRHYGSFATKK